MTHGRAAFEPRSGARDAIVPNDAAAAAAFQTWLDANPAPLPGAAPAPLTDAEIGALADVVGISAGLKRVPVSDASRDRALFAFERAALRDPQGAMIGWALGTNLAPPKTLNPDGQGLQVPREVTEFVRESDYRRTTALLSGTEPATSHDNRFTLDVIDGMRRGFARGGDAPVSLAAVDAAAARARAWVAGNDGRWSGEHDPEMGAGELGELRDLIGASVGLKKRPTSNEGYAAGCAVFEAALERDPAGAMIAWAKATDLPMPADSLERRGIDKVPRDLTAFSARSGATARTSALLDGVAPPPESDPTSYVEVAITAELRRSAERDGIDDLSPESLRRRIEEARKQGLMARRLMTDHFMRPTTAKGDDSGMFILKDLMTGMRAGQGLREMMRHGRIKRDQEQSLAAAVARGRMRLLPATTFERVAVPGIGDAIGPVGMAARFSGLAERVAGALRRGAGGRGREAEIDEGYEVR